MVVGKRKMLAAREDLADKASAIASCKGFTLFGFVNNLLELAISAESLGVSLEEAVDVYKVVKSVKDASYTLILENLMYETAEVAYRQAKDKILKIWFDAGVWVGKQYLSREFADPFVVIERDLKTFNWNVPEFTVKKLENEVLIRVLSPRFSESYTFLFSRFLEGILEAFGYAVRFREVGRGNIRLEAVKREVNAQK